MLKQLSGLDSFFLFAENPRAPLEVSSLHIYDPSTAPGGVVRFKEILATFESRMDRVDVFSRRLLEVPLSLDHPYWVKDPHFDIEHHVRHIALPKPGDWEQLMEQVARLQSYQLDHAKPLWEAYVIEGLDNIEGLNPGCFAVFLKMHHATVDGTTGIQIQQALHDLEPVRTDLSGYRRGRSKGPALPDNWDLLKRVPLNTVKKTARLVTGLALAAPGLVKAVMANRDKDKETTPRTVFNQGRVTANRVVDARIFSLVEIKEISKAVPGTTVNDVMLAVVSGALRKYLESKGSLPENTLVAACPVNARNSDGSHDGHDNMVSMMNTPLCTDIADPIKRMHAIHDGTLDAKTMIETVGTRTLTEVPMHLPAPLARNLLPLLSEMAVRTGTITFNTIMSNVVGIQQPIYLCGAEMVTMLGMGPLTDQAGLFHAVFSYNGRISVTITACRDMLPDPEFYTQCIEDAYVELREAAFPDAVKKPRSRKTAKKRAGKVGAKKKTAARASASKAGQQGKLISGRKKAGSRKKTGSRKKAGKRLVKRVGGDPAGGDTPQAGN